jgi:catechol 2,3-dioxygenase-like lactoylglutathione lyase family enzyme
MIKLNVASVMVLNQEEALDFYVNKLGLEKEQDIHQGLFRWLTVRAPGDPGIEIFLQEPGGLVIQTDDVRGLYEILRARGVADFTQEPTEHFYGIDMGIRDPFGNAIRILQPAKVAHAATA